MKLLLLGDIVGTKTVDYLQKNLWSLRRENKIDMVIANGENASFVTGISEEGAVSLLRGGVDCITGGNHTYMVMGPQQLLLHGSQLGVALYGAVRVIFIENHQIFPLCRHHLSGADDQQQAENQ